MTSVNGTGGPTTPAEIEADIIRQREELADTVSALQTKLDVKAKAKHKAAEMKDRATTEDGSAATDVRRRCRGRDRRARRARGLASPPLTSVEITRYLVKPAPTSRSIAR